MSILSSLGVLQGMLAEINMKKLLLSNKIEHSRSRELDGIKNSTIVLISEVDNINITLDIVESLISR